MAVAAHRAGDRGATGNGERLSEAAGIGVRPPGVWGRRSAAKPANAVTTGSNANPLGLTNSPNPENFHERQVANHLKSVLWFYMHLQGLNLLTVLG